MKFKEQVPTFFLIILMLILLLIFYIKNDMDGDKVLNVKMVPTLISNLEDENIVWSPTFGLIWNDLKNKIVKNDIVFLNDLNNQMALDLNQEIFIESDINSNYFYKKYGYMTPSLKEEIKNDIFNKFKETSDILDDFNFEDDSNNYFFYSMLVREFEFLYPFDILNDGEFGITKNSKDELDLNIKVLYYKDYKNYAVLLNTKEQDEIILVKGLDTNNFLEGYQILNFNNLEDFKEDDTISISNINISIKDSFREVENKKFLVNDEEMFINKTLQVINFKMNNHGAKVKSEAGMDVNKTALVPTRHFDFTSDFTLFVKEKDKNLPYFALKVKN